MTTNEQNLSNLLAHRDGEPLSLDVAAQIDADLALMAGTAGALRIYSLDGVQGSIPDMATRHGLDVTLGVELVGDPSRDISSVARLGEVTVETRSAQRAISARASGRSWG